MNIKLLNEYGKYENYLSNNHGYDYEYLIDLMISRFGFSKEDYDKSNIKIKQLFKYPTKPFYESYKQIK